MNSQSSDPLDNCLKSLAALRSSLASLKEALDAQSGVAFDIPQIRDEASSNPSSLHDCIEAKDNESSNAELWDQTIPVDRVDGKRGVRLCQAALLRITRRRNQPPKRPDRRPGLLWIPGKSGIAARKTARSVNDQKKAFKAAIEALKFNHLQRQQKFRSTPLQHVLLLQAYRAIQIIGIDFQIDPQDSTRVQREVPYPIDAVSFSWSGASRTVVRVHRDKVLDDIRRRKLFAGRTRWEQAILSLPDTEFAVVRRIAPFPVANLKIEGRWAKRVTASVPLIYTGPKLPEIRDLADYQPKNEPGQRNQESVRVDPIPLIAPMGLHRYLS